MKERFSVATQTDAGDVAALVNRAYRPAPAMGGWTHEASWVRGPRTTVAQVSALLNNGGVILTMADSSGDLIACVHVSIADAATCIGMLAADPALQGHGLGTQMLEVAERYAVEFGMPRTAVIDVLECRSELIAFYERRGYRRTGVVHPYPLTAGIGSPVVEGMAVVEMAKGINEGLKKSQAQLVRDGDLASHVPPKNFNLQ
jgi:GNAT superfamily N-acetyltransferase